MQAAGYAGTSSAVQCLEGKRRGSGGVDSEGRGIETVGMIRCGEGD